MSSPCFNLDFNIPSLPLLFKIAGKDYVSCVEENKTRKWRSVVFQFRLGVSEIVWNWKKKKTASLRIWYYYYTPLWERNFSVVSLLQVFLSLFSFFLVDRFVAWRNVSYFFFFLLLRVTKTLTNKSRNDTQPNWLSARLSDARIYLLEWQGKRKDLERERKKKVRPH